MSTTPPAAGAPRRPVIYLSNFASHRTEGHHGPGRKIGIVPCPGKHHIGDGQVKVLVPDQADYEDARDGDLEPDEFRKRYCATVHGKSYPNHPHGPVLSPGRLTVWEGWPPREDAPWDHRPTSPVREGDTLLCTCSRSDAAHRKCHRVIAAEILIDAGWAIVLDGELLDCEPLRDPRVDPQAGDVVELADGGARLAVESRDSGAFAVKYRDEGQKLRAVGLQRWRKLVWHGTVKVVGRAKG